MDTRMDTRTDTRTDPNMRRFLRILRFPLTRMVLLYYILHYLYLAGLLFRQTFAQSPLQSVAMVALMIGNVLIVYVGFVYVVEHRSVSELAPPRMGRELGVGLLLGFGLYTACVLIAMVLGLYRIEGLNSWQALLPALWFALSSGFFEELLFRGVILRITEEVFGSWVGLAFSSLVFGLVHLANEGETFAGIASIVIVFGPLLGATYMLTRRLWLGMGLHMAWNYTQSAVFSGAVSGGEPSKGLFKTTFGGPELLTGGSAGMEGSLIAILVSATASVILLILAVRRGTIVPPSWKRKHLA